MKLSGALRFLGADLVEDDPSECYSCKKHFRRLYLYGGSYEYPDDGELFCHACIKKIAVATGESYNDFPLPSPTNSKDK